MTKTEKELNCKIQPHHCHSSRLTVQLWGEDGNQRRLVEQALNNRTAQGVQQKTEQELAHNAVNRLQISVLL